MKEECLICKQSLEYLEEGILMECAICHKKENSKTRCVNGHYVCSECHTKGMDSIIGLCLNEHSKNPIEIINKMMSQPFCHMHGPEHHVMVGAALLTAYHNAGGELELEKALMEMYRRGKEVPGGACGFWGTCGAGISTGMYLSIVTKSTPLETKTWGLCNQMTGKALGKIGELNGPRCCKRDSYLAIIEAVKFTEEHLGISMETKEFFCTRSDQNNQCLKSNCPFHGKKEMPKKKKVAFICVHNSCRSQIAEALGKHLAADVFESYSAGTETKPKINQDAVRIMKILYGIDMEQTQYSKLIGEIPEPDLAISMGCNVECPFIGRPFDENWGLEDPTGKPDSEFEKIIAEIEKRVLELKERLRG